MVENDEIKDSRTYTQNSHSAVCSDSNVDYLRLRSWRVGFIDWHVLLSKGDNIRLLRLGCLVAITHMIFSN
jgi:hypothetical protein